MEAFIISTIQKYLLAGVFALLLACGLGVPMPEDVILITAGYISYLYPANINLALLVVVSMAGVLVGDTIIYCVGRRFGPSVTNLPVFRKLLTPARLTKMSGYFENYGNKIIFLGRFMAGIRAPLFLTAGISGLSYPRFIFFDGLAAMISVPLLVLLANHFGEEIDQLKFMLIKAQKALFVIVPAVIVVWLLFKKFARRREEEISEKPGPHGRREHPPAAAPDPGCPEKPGGEVKTPGDPPPDKDAPSSG